MSQAESGRALVEHHPRLDSLTGLRWWAAFGVFIFHMRVFAPVPVLSAFAPFGNSGVAFFFMLSGFVLTYSALRGTTTRNFYWRRFARIYPAHFVALLLAIPVFYSFSPDPAQSWVKPVSVGTLLLSVFLLQGWSRDPVILFSGNPAAWTLTVEAFFYFLHPLLNRFIRRLRTRGALLVCLAVYLAAVIHRIAVALEPSAWWAVSPFPVMRLSEFLIGMGLAQLVISGVRIRVRPIVSYLLLAFFLCGLLFAQLQGWSNPVFVWAGRLQEVVLIGIFALIILSVAMRDARGESSWLIKPVMLKLGAWSFAFYLVHATVMYFFMGIFGPQTASFSNLVWYVPVLGVAVPLAWALYRFVEQPLERKMRQWGNRTLA